MKYKKNIIMKRKYYSTNILKDKAVCFSNYFQYYIPFVVQSKNYNFPFVKREKVKKSRFATLIRDLRLASTMSNEA